MQGNIVKLPNELSRLREAERLVMAWISAQKLEGVEKMEALFAWRVDMAAFEQSYVSSDDDVKALVRK